MLRDMLDTNPCRRVLRDQPASLCPRFNAEEPEEHPGVECGLG